MATGTRAHSTGACSSAAYSGFGDGTYSSALSEDSDDAASENGSAPALSESSAVSSAMSHSLAASEEGDLPWASPATSARAAAPTGAPPPLVQPTATLASRSASSGRSYSGVKYSSYGDEEAAAAKPPMAAPAARAAPSAAPADAMRKESSLRPAESMMTSVSAASACTSISAGSVAPVPSAAEQPAPSAMTSVSALTSDAAAISATAPAPTAAKDDDAYSYYSDEPPATAPAAPAATAAPAAPAADDDASYYSYSPQPSAAAPLPAAAAAAPAGVLRSMSGGSRRSSAKPESMPTTGAQTVVGSSNLATEPVAPPPGIAPSSGLAGKEDDEFEYAYVYEDEVKKAELASGRGYEYGYVYTDAMNLQQARPLQDSLADLRTDSLAERAAAAASAVGAAAAAAARAAAGAPAIGDETERSLTLPSDRSIDSQLLPSRTPSVMEAEERVALAAETQAAIAAEAAIAAANAYKPIEMTPLAPAAFADEACLEILPPSVAQIAQHYHAAASRVHEALHKQRNTLRAMQYATARLRAEVVGEGEGVPEGSWDEEASLPANSLLGPTGLLSHASSTSSKAQLLGHVRRVVDQHGAEQPSPFVALAVAKANAEAKAAPGLKGREAPVAPRLPKGGAAGAPSRATRPGRGQVF